MSTLGTEPWSWTLTDLQRLVADGVKENLQLDYKASAALTRTDRSKTELSKDVAAFANSAGGTLVYGVAEVGHCPDRIDEGLSPTEITREWLEQVIHSQVQPRIEGIRISPIDLATGRVAYVVWVPQSDRAPHMAGDHRYYKRHNFQSSAMEDYEVRDILRRVQSPVLRLELGAKRAQAVRERDPNGDEVEYRVVDVTLTLTNHSLVMAEYCQVRIFLDPRLRPVSTDQRAMPACGHDRSEFQAVRSVPGDAPVWFGLPQPLPGIRARVECYVETDYQFRWECYAPPACRTVGRGVIRVSDSERENGIQVVDCGPNDP